MSNMTVIDCKKNNHLANQIKYSDSK